MAEVKVDCLFKPELDPEFVPAILWNREYRKLAASVAGSLKIAITLERSNGAVSRFDTVLLPETEEYAALNLRYVERIVKFMLWSFGGWHVTIADSWEPPSWASQAPTARPPPKNWWLRCWQRSIIYYIRRVT